MTQVRDVGIGTGIGAFSGLLGVGGGLLLVPFLVLTRGMEQKRAQATSLVMVFTAAAGGAVTYAVNASIAWFPALFIVIGGLVGSWVGTHTVQRTPDHWLQLCFGLLLGLVALRLVLTNSQGHSSDLNPTLALTAGAGYVLSGVAMGFLSALFGIGGGILLIPILVTVFGYHQQLASGTSLAVMLPIAVLGAVRLGRVGLTEWSLGLRFGIGAIAGAAVGALLALSLPADVLRYAFSVVMVLVGLRMARQGWLGLRRSRRNRRPGSWPASESAE